MDKQHDNLKAHREEKVDVRLNMIHSALAKMSGRYKSLTALAKDVAKYVTVFEAAENSKKSEATRSKPLRPVSHITILRNVHYRTALQAFFDGGVDASTPQPLVDYNALLLELEELRSKNNLLKIKLTDAFMGWELADDHNSSALPNEDKVMSWLELLLSVINKMQELTPGTFDNVTDPKGKRGRGPGLHCPMGIAASPDEMLELHEIKQAISKWHRQQNQP